MIDAPMVCPFRSRFPPKAKLMLGVKLLQARSVLAKAKAAGLDVPLASKA